MGMHSIVNNKKKPLRSKGNKVRRGRMKIKAAKKGEKNVIVENIEFLSKGQLKKLIKNPKNSIRPSGKRKQKVMKRLRHSQKEKNTMEVEATDPASTSTTTTQAPGKGKGKGKGKKSKKSEAMDTDIVEDASEAVIEGDEMT